MSELTRGEKRYAMKFLQWLFPARYEETATCSECGAVVSKTRMIHATCYGWFCNESELAEYCERFII
jgi:hypothetical protein